MKLLMLLLVASVVVINGCGRVDVNVNWKVACPALLSLCTKRYSVTLCEERLTRVGCDEAEVLR